MFTDIHYHGIWGVDDGADTFEATKRMIDESVVDGVNHLVCTPHMTPGVYPFETETFELHLQQTQEYIASRHYDLRLDAGGEVLYTDSMIRFLREGRLPVYGTSRYILTEFSPDDSWQRITAALSGICRVGYRPVIAHVERCLNLKKADQLLYLKHEYGALLQVNARTVLRKPPFFQRKYYTQLIEDGLTDFIATDTHDYPGRETCMTKAYEALLERVGKEQADRLCGANAEALLFGANQTKKS